MTLIADKEVRVEEPPVTPAAATTPIAAETASPLRPHRRRLLLPGHLGMVALGLALVAAALSFFVFYGMVDWFLPIFLIGPAIALGAYALSQHTQRKGAAIAAIVIATLALMPPTATLALAGYSSALDGGSGLTGDSDLTAFDALQTITGQDGANGSNGTGTNGANGQNGTSGTNGTNGSNGTDGTDGEDGTDGTDTTIDPVTGNPIIDVDLDLGLGGGTPATPTVPSAPVIAVDLNGVVGDILTTSANVKVKVGSVTCGLPLVSVLGISLSLFNNMCAVAVSVTNSGSAAVAINSGSLTGVSGGSSILGDVGIGTSPLSTTVAAGATVNGNLYVKLPNASSVLDRLELRLGGELLKVQVR